MFTALLPIICVPIGSLTVSLQLVMSWPYACYRVCVSVLLVYGVVLLSVQNAAMFTALLPMVCVSIGPLTVSVKLLML